MSNTSYEREGLREAAGKTIRAMGGALDRCQQKLRDSEARMEQLTQELERETTRAREAEQELTRRGRRERAAMRKLREVLERVGLMLHQAETISEYERILPVLDASLAEKEQTSK